MQLLSIKMKEIMDFILWFNCVMDIYDYPHSSTDRTLTLVRDTSLNLVVGPPSIMLDQVCLFYIIIYVFIAYAHGFRSWKKLSRYYNRYKKLS